MASNKLSKNDGIDRISNLHDSILERILSHLPLKYAVAASILSTRWNKLSPFGISPVTIDLDDSLILHRKENDESNSHSTSFVDFADKMLYGTFSDDSCVETVILELKKNYGVAKILSWVGAALSLKVQWLHLAFSLRDTKTLFKGLNGCTTLVGLILVLDSELSLPRDFHLPHLKTLHLSELIFEDGGSINELIKGCPVLENLCITRCYSADFDHLIIKAPLLKKLKIERSWINSICELSVDAPNLEVLWYDDCVAWAYDFLSELKSLRKVHINVGPSRKQLDEAGEGMYCEEDGSWSFDNEVAKLVTACSSTISLYLSEASINALCRSFMLLPVFQNLRVLSLGCMGLHGWALLARLLKNAPNLEKLTFDEEFEKNKMGFTVFESLLPDVPICLELHLKKIEFLVFEEDENEIKLIEYFLKNGKVLQELALYCTPNNYHGIYGRLCMLPRQSKTCKILFKVKQKSLCKLAPLHGRSPNLVF